jgi:hypothetical protein
MNGINWKVYVVEESSADGGPTSSRLVYSDRWMPTIDNMAIVSAVRGRKYRVVAPDGTDKTHLFPYGTPT